jgi:hypothetical protein
LVGIRQDGLVAIQEIRDQIARYAIFFDDKNWDEFAELWTDDAAFVGPGMAFEGKRAVLDFLVNCLPDDYTGKHMNSRRWSSCSRRIARGRAPTSSGSRWISRTARRPLRRRYCSGSSTGAGSSSGTEVVVPFRAGSRRCRTPRWP